MKALSGALLTWYRKHGRDLPWRRSPDPYAVWVSEIMLQQTQVVTATPYFERWMRLFPTVQALAVADENQVLQAWQGLGYYSRAKALLKGARAVMSEHAGQVPKTVLQLRSLPGVGPYTAGAISSIAYENDEPVVDGNVTRVLTRLFALRGDPMKAPLKTELWQYARKLIPVGEARDFNQALMEFGALCCTPKKPDCGGCPVRRYCQAHALGDVQQFPQTRARPKVTPVYVSAAVVHKKGQLLLVQLSADAPRWASMWQFPNLEHPPERSGEAVAECAVQHYSGLTARASSKLFYVKHSVTRYQVHLSFYRAACSAGRLNAQNCASVRWCSPAEIEQLALPAAHRRFAKQLGHR